MNYEEMSDFEINCAVARALAFEPIMFFDVDSSICHGPVWNVTSGITDEGIRVSKGVAFNPCNSWTDAGPIIQEYRISVCAFHLPEEDKDHNKWFADMPDEDIEDFVVDRNPLRAAMIAFLKN